ncbi:MAG: hypothetical protein RLZZ330_539 [Actinomycetota bacterium]|jgi:hypothetical protein
MFSNLCEAERGRHYYLVDTIAYQNRLKKRRLIIVSSVLFGIVLASGLLITKSPSAKPDTVFETQTSSDQIETDSEQNWLLILQNLDTIRVDAIVHRDISTLANVYSRNSPLQQADVSLIQDLIESEMEISDLSFEISDLTLISHRWSNDEEVVELSISSTRSAYKVNVDGEVKQRVSQKESSWLVSLVKSGDYWLIGNAEIDLDNS